MTIVLAPKKEIVKKPGQRAAEAAKAMQKSAAEKQAAKQERNEAKAADVKNEENV